MLKKVKLPGNFVTQTEEECCRLFFQLCYNCRYNITLLQKNIKKIFFDESVKKFFKAKHISNKKEVEKGNFYLEQEFS